MTRPSRPFVVLLLLDQGALFGRTEEDLGDLEREVDGVVPHLGRRRVRGGRVGDGGIAHGLGRRRLVRARLLEHRVLDQLLLDELLELHRGELEELDRLLQHRRHDETLRLAERESGFDGHVRPPRR